VLISVSSSTTIFERPPTFGELCHAASLRSTSFVVMSPMTAFVHWLCLLYTPGSTTAISSWSGFWHIYSDNSSPFSMLQLVWCFVYAVRPCHRRPCNSALAASTTAGRLQGGCHGVSCITRSNATLSEPASSCLRPTQSSPTSFFIVTAAACAAVPPHNRRSTLLSSRCITPMELTANWHSVISIPTCFSSTP